MLTFRGVLLALLVLGAGLSGCTSAPKPPAPPEVAMLLALDGRWDFSRAAGEAALAKAGLPTTGGAAWFGETLLAAKGTPHAVDYAAFEIEALSVLGANLTPPPQGQVLVDRAFASEARLQEGDDVTLRTWRWPVPLVATSFEMDRTRPCDPELPARLCFSASLEGTTTELHLRVDEGSQDLAFLPDLAELGAGAAPAWWNGTFVSPSGEETPFQAWVDAEGVPTLGERAGPMEPGTWLIRYHLETAKSGRLPAGFAGIVRVREPGYQWFDDRLQASGEGESQARAVLARGRPHETTLRVLGLVDLPASLRAQVLLAPDDARTLQDLAPGRVDGLVLRAPADAQERMLASLDETSTYLALALHLRPFAAPPPPGPVGEALVFRAPPDVDVAALPPVAGAGQPTLAVALRPPVAANVSVDDRNLTYEPRILAHAGPDERPPPWTLPPGARWGSPREAMENLSRSRTLVLGSADLGAGPISVSRLVLGDDRSGRVAVLVGSVAGGPAGTFWASAPMVAGAGEPAGARVVLPLAPGADAGQALAEARAAWAPFGLAPEPSSKP